MNENPPPTEPSKKASSEEKAEINPYLELGQGVARTHADGDKQESQKAPEENKKEEEQTPTPMKEGNWMDLPSYDDQYSKYPQTTRSRGPHFSVFDMSDISSAKALDTLMDKQYPETAPQIIPIDVTKQFCEQTGNWKILVSYYTVQYRKLLPSNNTP
jgi:hypothetical protein